MSPAISIAPLVSERHTMNKTFATLTTACFAGALVLGGATIANATPEPKVSICHSTSSEENPWNLINVSANALKGHEKHDDDLIPAPADGCPIVEPAPIVEETPDEPDPDPAPDPAVVDIQCRVTASTVIGGTATLTVAPADCNIPTAPISFSSYELENKLVLPYDKQVAFDHATDAGVAYGAGDYTLTVELPDCNWQSDLYWSPNGENQVSAPHSHPVNGMNVGWDFTEGNDCTVVVPPVEPPVVEPPVVVPPVEPTTPVAAFVPQQLPTLPVTELAYTGSSPLVPAGIASLLLAVGAFLVRKAVSA